MKVGTIVEKAGIKYMILPNDMAAEVAYIKEDGTPVLRATATSKEEGIDEHGNKKVSTQVNVECFRIQLTEQKA